MRDEANLHEGGRIDALERRLTNLERTIGKLMTDIFDRIAAAIEAKNSGDNAAYDAHFAVLDQQYAALQGTVAGDETNIAAIQAGLSKIADAVNPPAPTPAPATGDGTTTGADAGGTTAPAPTPTPSATDGTASSPAPADPNAPPAA